MTDTFILKEKISESGMKITYIASYVGISRQLLWRKINNRAPFNQFEIDKLCTVLKIRSMKEKEAIFFAKNVD